MADLSRDTANAHNALENNFDKQAIKDKLEIQQQASSLGTQAMTAYMDSKLDAAKKKVRDEMAARGELKGLSDEEINDKVTASAEFKEVDKEYGIGSPFWTASSAMTGLLAGVLGGNVQSGMAAGAAPVLAKLVKEATHESDAARIALHTVISAALAKAQGGNATAGAIGGFIASAGAEQFAQALYGKKADQLNPDEKMVILNLVSAVGAVGGGVATGNTNGMVSAGNAARVEVENNSLYWEYALQAAANNAAAAGGAAGNGTKGSGKGDSWDNGGGCEGTREQCAVRDGTRGPGHTELPIADQDPTGGKLVNPDQSEAQGATDTGKGAGGVDTGPNNTANNGGSPNTGGNTTVTPIPDGPNKDDLAYLDSGATGSNIVNPATNKVPTEHTVVSSGKAPKKSTPNSVYEVSRADGTKSITYYDDRGNMFSREDYGQQRTHGTLGYDSNGNVPPHEHKVEYNANGQPIGKYYRELDQNGNVVGGWVSEK
ncbi:VENN motif pre-toxin domain-containing protein [Kosakonia oryzendophytica]|uniref:VENN motif pre-toxin domain-containing protein n=1 Tax=Kosakonia oryzendophytica TaxID=1005665 RepID=UPI003D33FFC9